MRLLAPVSGGRMPTAASSDRISGYSGHGLPRPGEPLDRENAELDPRLKKRGKGQFRKRQTRLCHTPRRIRSDVDTNACALQQAQSSGRGLRQLPGLCRRCQRRRGTRGDQSGNGGRLHGTPRERMGITDSIRSQAGRIAVKAQQHCSSRGGEGPFCWITETLRLVASTFGVVEGTD